MVKPMTPYVKIDYLKVEKNIKNMIDSLSKYNIKHRPHVKTHKSVELAKLEIKAGAIGISCATLTELEIMAAAGINNILLAFPLIGNTQCRNLYEILKKYNFEFTTIVDSEEGLAGLNAVGRNLNKKINVYIDIDSGGHREGIQSESVLSFTKKVLKTEWVRLTGIFTYFGHIYKYETKDHAKKSKEEANILLNHQRLLAENGIQIDNLSGGSTVSSNNPEQLAGITESRAGNFIFYDMNAVHLGLVSPEECALRVVAKVVSKPVAGKLTIDAGSKALSTDDPLKGDAYGYVISHPELKIVSLNEEHGFVEYNEGKIDLNIGDNIEIIPNHACVVPNLYNKVFLFEGNELLRPMAVEAKGKSYW